LYHVGTGSGEDSDSNFQNRIGSGFKKNQIPHTCTAHNPRSLHYDRIPGRIKLVPRLLQVCNATQEPIFDMSVSGSRIATLRRFPLVGLSFPLYLEAYSPWHLKGMAICAKTTEPLHNLIFIPQPANRTAIACRASGGHKLL